MRFKLLALALAAVGAASAFADDGLTLKTGYDYSSGKYGTNTTTTISAIPFIASYDMGDWRFKASVPYVRITGANNVVAGLGVVRRAATTATRTDSGLGDITTSATYSIIPLVAGKPGIDITGKIKFGTADSNKSLGTGRNDYYILVDAFHQIGSTTFLGGVGYGTLGSSDTLKLKDVAIASIGVSFKLDNVSSVGTSYDYRSKATDTGANQRDLTAFYSRKLSANYKLQAYASKGFSDGSPDFGAGLNVGYSF